MSVMALNIVITLPLLMAGTVQAMRTDREEERFSCFGGEGSEKNKLKYLYPDSEGFNITIRSSNRMESRLGMKSCLYFYCFFICFRLLTEIFKILVEEKLNFRVWVLDDNQTSSLDEEELQRKTKPVFDPEREEMVWLDKLMPMSQPVDLIDQMEVGHLGPAIRYSN